MMVVKLIPCCLLNPFCWLPRYSAAPSFDCGYECPLHSIWSLTVRFISWYVHFISPPVVKPLGLIWWREVHILARMNSWYWRHYLLYSHSLLSHDFGIHRTHNSTILVFSGNIVYDINYINLSWVSLTQVRLEYPFYITKKNVLVVERMLIYTCSP